MRIVIAMAVALMVASHSLPAGADERSDRAKWLYDLVMDRVGGSYGSLNEPKVMAICIDWEALTESGIYVHNVFSTYTSMGTDVPVFLSKLARDAEFRCKQWAKSEKIDCTCQMLDSNGKNVLSPPAVPNRIRGFAD
jgi:hypothetical protein